MDGALHTPGFFTARLLIDISYFVTACLFILGLKRMSSPVTARSGIVWAGAGMLVATLVTFLYPGMTQLRAHHRRDRRRRRCSRGGAASASR